MPRHFNRNEIFHIQGDCRSGKTYLMAEDMYRMAVEEHKACVIVYRDQSVLTSFRNDVESRYADSLTASAIHNYLIFRRNDVSIKVPIIHFDTLSHRLRGIPTNIIYLQDENWTLREIAYMQQLSRGASIVWEHELRIGTILHDLHAPQYDGLSGGLSGGLITRPDVQSSDISQDLIQSQLDLLSNYTGPQPFTEPENKQARANDDLPEACCDG